LGGNPPVSWFDRVRDSRRKALAQLKSDEAKKQAAFAPNTRPSRDLADFCGAYEHPAYGRVVVTQQDDSLHWAWRGTKSKLAHRHYDSFQLPYVMGDLNPDDLLVTFATDRDGNVASLSIQLEVLVADIIFKRAASGECMDPAFRAACAGNYVRGDATHVVSVDAEGQLTLKIPYQPLYQLRPYQGASFAITVLDGYRTEFRRGASGAIEELVYHQPNGTFIAKRSNA
jgi:hypothetical protein